MENKMIKSSVLEKKGFLPLKAVNAKTKFVEAGKRKIAYRSIGKGLPIILVKISGIQPSLTLYPQCLMC